MRFTIYRIALLLVAAPVLIQVIFVIMLVQTHAERAVAQRWAVHTKEVIGRVEEIYRRLLEGYAGVGIMVNTLNPTLGQPSQELLHYLPDKLGELREMVRDNEPQKTRVDRMAAQATAFLNWLSSQETRIGSGERGKALDALDEGARLLQVVRKTTDTILAVESDLDVARMERLERSGNRQTGALVVGGFAFLATILGLSLVFLQNIVKRLDVLKENARAYGDGRALVPVLEGSDEIAEVDRAFHDMAANLDQQKQENEMFVYSVSHDLRSPLINLQGFSEELMRAYEQLQELLRKDAGPGAARHDGLKLVTENIEESIHYIQAAVGRLARIIDALLRLSRAGRVEYQWQSLNTATIVSRIVDALHDTISEKKAELVVGSLPDAWGDPTAVEQIFANLIGNAVQYLDPKRPGRIEVGSQNATEPTSGAAVHVYYVKDNGLGIPEAYHRRVFTVFSRLHADVPQGEGVGLALVRRVVERHGGKIWLESAQNVGTTFFIALPAAAPSGVPDLGAAPVGSKGR